MNKEAIQNWLSLTDQNRRNIFLETANKMNLTPSAVEKDWWVVRTLELVFLTEIAPFTVFKGGTSLSKAWNLIKRFSEDIDLALDRKFLSFPEEMSRSQVAKLRKKSLEYISVKYLPQLQCVFHDAGFTEVTLQLTEIKSPDEDPVKIEVIYPALTEKSDYLAQRVLIEIGSRSLIEPYTVRKIVSFVGEQFPGAVFSDAGTGIPTVNPERTFLEKIFLLHEEFQQSPDKIKVERISRHLYDIERMMDTGFGTKALTDHVLYDHIVEHRRTITPLRGIDYSHHVPVRINPLPPDDLIDEVKKDYELMRHSMIFIESLPFDMLMDRISELKNRINTMSHG